MNKPEVNQKLTKRTLIKASPFYKTKVLVCELAQYSKKKKKRGELQFV